MIDALVLTIAAMVAKTPYNLIEYNCWDYATDLRADLLKAGIPARIVTGVLDGGPHSWISVNGTWIEPQSASIVTPADGYQFGYYSPPKINPFKFFYLWSVRNG